MDNNRLTGSYYTSQKIAQYMVDWAIRDASDSFLEPSFGDGVFLDAAVQRYNDFTDPHPAIIGVELQPTVYSKYMEGAGRKIQGFCQDFLTFTPSEKIMSVVGNPLMLPCETLMRMQEPKQLIAPRKTK